MEIKYILLFSIFYLVGSIPFAYIFTKIFGLGDIRSIGSGNVGATNVLRTGNKILALIVLILDIFKGFIPFIILKNNYDINDSFFIFYLIGGMTIIGHIFPIWLKFKGGKGVATYIGFILAIDYTLCLLFIIFWIIIALFKRYSSLSSIISLLITPLLSFVIFNDIVIFSILFSISLLIIIKHKSNIIRLLTKSESKIKF
tara:strand:- start:191 stop:790 length:600 start_codon:yes stop_codon:yes gene_type:complete